MDLREEAAPSMVQGGPRVDRKVRGERLAAHDRIDERSGRAQLVARSVLERRRGAPLGRSSVTADLLRHRLHEGETRERHDRGHGGPGSDE